MPLKWVKVDATNYFPQNAVVGGWEQKNWRTVLLYVGRADIHESDHALHPGKVFDDETDKCYSTYKNRDHKESQYEVLVNEFEAESAPKAVLKWEYCNLTLGIIPEGAFLGGRSINGHYYIGHFSHKGNLLVGKVNTAEKKLFAAYHGEVVRSDECNVLVEKGN